MSLLENVAFGLSAHPRGRRREMAQHMLERVGLAARGNDLPHRLSGGQQQRVALARAMAPRPRLLLLDEPFSNLDVRLRHRTRLDTLRLLKDSHTSSILVTHDPDEAMFMADRIALMQEGRIVQLGSPADLYRHPASPFAALFFGDLNRIAGVVRNGMVATPVGEFDAGSMTDGTAVEVLVRPESIQAVAGTSTGIAARVTSCRMLGSISLLGLRIVTQDAQTFDLQAQVAGSEAFNEDSPLHIRVDSQGVFVFPAASADDRVP